MPARTRLPRSVATVVAARQETPLTLAPLSQEFFQSSVHNFKTLFTLRLAALTSPSPPTPSLALHQLSEHLAKYVKMYRSILAQNASVFIELGSTVEIVEAVWEVIRNASADVSKIDAGELDLVSWSPACRSGVNHLVPSSQRTASPCTRSGSWSAR